MPREIWNQGRVVGYSAYEVYVKQHLAEDPTSPPASERQWLASSLAMGTSMLVKIPNISQSDENSHTFFDIELPANSRLAAANTIMASFFDGDAAFNGNWATKITDYGALISNNTTKSPANGKISTSDIKTKIPTQTISTWSETKKNKLKDYMKIVDGVILQPGTWKTNANKPPQKDFEPDLTSPPVFRILVKGSITNSPYILLTGFTIRAVLIGITGGDTSVNTLAPEDGDFLGPGAFPWANEVIFSVPTSYIAYFASGGYVRKLPSDSADIGVHDTATIDMKSGSGDGGTNAPVLENYYNIQQATDIKFYSSATSATTALTAKKSSRVPNAVSAYSSLGDGEAVITVYEKKAIYPPALYGTFVDSTGNKFLHPIDTVAPGSVKMFYKDDGTTMKDYQDTFPGTTSINKTADGTLEILDPSKSDGTKVPAADIVRSKIAYSSGTSSAYGVKLTTGKKSAFLLDLSTATSPTGVQTTISTGTVLSGSSSSSAKVQSLSSEAWGKNNLTWYALLEALATDKGLDILQDRLKSAQNTLIRANTAGTSGPYLEFGPENKKIRLYICNEEPEVSDVPVGSIGIGWGFNI